MALFSFFSRKPRKSKPHSRNVRLSMESLENRLTPAGTISGFVYADANNNGIFEAGETPLAGVTVQLKSNTTNQIVATATTDATGAYLFTHDNTIQTTPTSITKTLSFPSTDTNFNLSGTVQQFDPTLGQLTSIDIIHDGSITSSILVENTSKSSGATINGTVSGGLTLSAPGVNDTLTLNQNAGTITVAAFDGATDFNGASGANLGTKTATGTKTTTITGAALAQWTGTGTVTIQEAGTATSSATGGGNLSTAITSTGKSTITVKYNYVPTNGLQPGPYTVIETQPAGLLDGKDAKDNVPIPNSHLTDFIVLQLANVPLVNNNFGELRPASISGVVYHDANNNGLQEGGEVPIPGAAVALTGADDTGAAVNLAATTDGAGGYSFTNLRPGTYTVKETQPAAYSDGKDTPGTVQQGIQGFIAGTTAVNDQIAGIGLPAGANSAANNFGELQTSSLSGNVYVDANKNGSKDGGEAPIAGVTITLSGFSADGPVNQTTTTDANGFYQFQNLKPGTYAITETQPTNFGDGQESLGTLGGVVGADVFSAIVVASGVNGTSYNFGEVIQDDADVGIVKSANAITNNVGDTLTYTLVVTNYGAFTAKGLTVIDTLPPGAGYLSGSGVGWTVTQAGGIVTATMPSLAVGATATITISIRVPATSNTITNNATVTTTTTDKVPGNNTSTVTTNVVTPRPQAQALQPRTMGGGISKNDFLADPYGINEQLARNAGIVNALFQTVLNRQPDDQAGINYALQLFNGASQASIFNQLWTSDEHRNIQAASIYKTVFNRTPTAAEQAAAVGQLKAGASEAVVARGLYTSAEYQTAHPNSADLVGSIYASAAGALPTAAANAAAVQSMANSPLDQVVANIQNSDAALGNSVRVAYRSALRREASDAEVAAWVGQMKGGLSLDGLFANLFASSEFQTLARSTIV